MKTFPKTKMEKTADRWHVCEYIYERFIIIFKLIHHQQCKDILVDTYLNLHFPAEPKYLILV